MRPLIPLIGFLFLTSFAFTQDNRFAPVWDASVAEQFTAKLAAMLVTDDPGKVRNVQQDFQRLCFRLGAPGNESQKKELVDLMLNALDDSANAAVHTWLIRQVGRLGDGAAAKRLGKFLDVDDMVVRNEALWALSNIPGDDAKKVLADKLAVETNAERGDALKQAIRYHATPEKVTLKSLDEMLTILATNDEKAWEATLPSVGWLKNAKIDAVPNFKDRFAKLSVRTKVLLIDALAEVQDRSALPLAVDLAKSDDATLQLAGYRAFGKIGDKSVLPLLVEKIREGENLGHTVRDSLRRLNFDGADQAIIEAYDSATDNGVKNELLESLRRRRGDIAIPVFEKALTSEDGGIRGRAIWALETIGETTSIPPLVDRFLIETNNDARGAIERAIIAINNRYADEDGRGQVFCDVIAKKNVESQRLLLPILGRIGGTAPRKAIAEFAKNPALADMAFRALCAWPDASVADELYQFATSDDEAKSREATRAYLRVISLRADRSAKDSLALFEKGMKLAQTVEDKKFLLVRVETARSREVFDFVVPYLDDADLVQEASRAVVDMANDHGFYMSYRQKIDPALDKVMERSKDNNHVERAKRYKERRL